MSSSFRIASLLLTAAISLAVGCSGDSFGPPAADGSPPPGGVAAPDPDGLKAAFAKLQDAIRDNDQAAAARLTKAFFPDASSIQKAVKDPAVVTKIEAMHAQFSAGSDAEIARIFATNPERSEIAVHAASTEEIAAYEKGGPASSEFPGGAKTAAESVLQPGMIFYEVELLEPGKDLGLKFHLFFHDGQNWKMLGPIWRVL